MAHPWHRPAHRTQRSIQRELAETEGCHVNAQLPARAKDSEGDRQVKARSLLAALGRREIHSDPTERELEAGIPHGSAHALSRFLHRRVGQPHNDQRRQAVRDVNLDCDECCLETPERAGGHTRDGTRGRWPVRRRDRDSEEARRREAPRG